MIDNSFPRIKLSGVTKRFGFGDTEHVALDNIDLEVQKGEFIAIVGPSGCGKTTLLNILGLLDHPSEGEYYLDNESVEDLTAQQHATLRSRDIGFIFQHFNLIPRLSVIDNVALPLTYKGVGKTKRLQEASRILRNFHLGEREYYLPHQLSGGQVQRVAIARALVNSPSIILADEPTGNLDSKSSHIIMEELADIHRRGNTIIMVTHNPELLSYASRVISMLDGRIDTDEQRTRTLYRKRLEEDNEPKVEEQKEPAEEAKEPEATEHSTDENKVTEKSTEANISDAKADNAKSESTPPKKQASTKEKPAKEKKARRLLKKKKEKKA